MLSTEEGWLWWNCTLHTHLSALFRVDEDAPGLFELMLRRVSEVWWSVCAHRLCAVSCMCTWSAWKGHNCSKMHQREELQMPEGLG